MNRTTTLDMGGFALAHFRSHSTTNNYKKQKASSALYGKSSISKSEFDAGSSILVELPLVLSTMPKMQTDTSTSAEGGESPILEKPIGD